MVIQINSEAEDKKIPGQAGDLKETGSFFPEKLLERFAESESSHTTQRAGI